MTQSKSINSLWKTVCDHRMHNGSFADKKELLRAEEEMKNE